MHYLNHDLILTLSRKSLQYRLQVYYIAFCQIQVQSLKSKVQRKGTGNGADTIIIQATHHPTHNFSHFKCQSSVRKRPSMTFYDLP